MITLIKKKIDQTVKKGRQVYILEVDIKYLKDAHKKHNEFLFLLENWKQNRSKNLYKILRTKRRI